MLYRPGLLGRMPCPQDWYMPSAPPTIDVSFAGSLPSGWAFTRASTGTDSTYLDAPGQQTYNTLGVNAPLIDQWGIKVEPQSTNYYLNSDAPALQQIACTGGQVLVIWFVGTSTAQVNLTVMSGTFSNVGSVLPNTWRTVTCTAAGSLQVNVFAGTVYRIQCETNSSNLPTSYIVTGGTSATRQETRLNANFFGGQLNVNNGTYWLEYMATSWHNSMLMSAGVGSYTQPNETDDIMMSGASIPRCAVVAPANSVNALLLVGGVFSAMGINRVAMSYTPTRIAACGNYGTVGSTVASARPATLLAITLGNGGGGLLGTYPLNGYIRGFRYWPSTMSDQELHECTGAGYYAGKPVFDLDGTQANQWRMWQNMKSSSGNTGTATDALMTDPAGTAYNQYAGVAQRFTPRGLFLDIQRANYITNSYAPVSGVTASLAAGQTYMLSMRGSGSATLNAGTGTGGFPITATAGNPATVTMTTTGNANLVCTGTVEIAQLEQIGASVPPYSLGPTSFIRTTTAGQTRTYDGLQIPLGPWWNNAQGTLIMDFSATATSTGLYLWGVDDGTSNVREQAFSMPNTAGSGFGVQTVWSATGSAGRIDPDPSQTNPFVTGVMHRMAYAYSSDRKRQLVMDGLLGGSTGNLTRPTGQLWMRIGVRHDNLSVSPSVIIKRWRYYDYMLSDADMIALTSAADLDLSFMQQGLDARITVTRAGVATVVDQTGTILTFGANTSRLDYDPITHTVLGTLIEEQRINIMLQSGNFGHATWIKSTCSVSGTFACPDGTNAAYGLVSNAGALGFVYQNMTLAAATSYTLSVFAKAGSQNQCALVFANPFFSDAVTRVATFNLSDSGSVASVTGAGASATIQQFPNGWYRCSFTVLVNNAATSNVQALRPPNNGDGTNIQVYGWGAQLEAGAFPTSYIPTTTATVTRNADLLTMPTSSAWFTPASGTMMTEYIQRARLATGNQAVMMVDDGVGNRANCIDQMNAASNGGVAGAIRVGVANTALLSNLYNAATGVVNKSAISWSASTFSGTMNGDTVGQTVAVVGGLPPSLTRFVFASLNQAGVSPMNGWIRAFKYWSVTHPISIMARLTT